MGRFIEALVASTDDTSAESFYTIIIDLLKGYDRPFRGEVVRFTT